MEGKVKIGKVTRLHGYKGELSLKFEADYGELFETLDHVFLAIDKKPIPFFIDSVRFTSQGYALVFFEGVGTQEDAERLRGATIWIDEDSIPKDFINEDALINLVGHIVWDAAKGELGKVTSVVEHPGQSFLVIDREDGEILIPYVDHIIKEIDDSKQTISIEAPEGLIDLNLD